MTQSVTYSDSLLNIITICYSDFHIQLTVMFMLLDKITCTNETSPQFPDSLNGFRMRSHLQLWSWLSLCNQPIADTSWFLLLRSGINSRQLQLQSTNSRTVCYSSSSCMLNERQGVRCHEGKKQKTWEPLMPFEGKTCRGAWMPRTINGRDVNTLAMVSERFWSPKREKQKHEKKHHMPQGHWGLPN